MEKPIAQQSANHDRIAIMEDWQDLADLIPMDDHDSVIEAWEIINEVMDCE